MSRYTNFHFRNEREGRVAQMTKQEEVIARKRQELLEKQKTTELAKQVAAAQAQSINDAPQTQSDQTTTTTTTTIIISQQNQLPIDEPIKPKNSFNNDGSFFENFKKITEAAAKKAEEEKQKHEREEAMKKAIEEGVNLAKLTDAAYFTPITANYSATSVSSPTNINFPMATQSTIDVETTTAETTTTTTTATTIVPPPPPPPPIQSIHSEHIMIIAPAEELLVPNASLNTIPTPLDLDLTAIPEPMMNIELIQMPDIGIDTTVEGDNEQNKFCSGNDDDQSHSHQFDSIQLILNIDNNKTTINEMATIPTTIDGLIEYIAINGDQYEDKIFDELTKMNEPTLFRFLNDRNSDGYKMFREKVVQLRQKRLTNADKYDPEDLLTELIDGKQQQQQQQDQQQQEQVNSMDKDNEDEYDSDTEYMQETKERNLKNMQRKIDEGENMKRLQGEKRPYYSSDDDDDDDDDDDSHTDEEDHMEMYRKIQLRESALYQSDDAVEYSLKQNNQNDEHDKLPTTTSQLIDSKIKKKRSRWGEKIPDDNVPIASAASILSYPSSSSSSKSSLGQNKTMLSTITRSDPALLNYAKLNYGTINLTEDDWKKCEDHFKVNLLYQDMLKKRNEIDRLARTGKFKYEYDSDEDVNGGTWEHKLRTAEMQATALWSDALNEQSQGKHHIGDFLPPEELKNFLEKYNSKQTNREPDLSDYKEYKLKEDNKGFQMLQKLGWKEGQGLGNDGAGIVDPINKAPQRENNQGLGSTSAASPEAGDNEYDAYRKRMMLAYRFRPNPLNNPRRAYY